MKRLDDAWVIAMTEDERDALLEALDDVVNRYESADEHVDNKHCATLRALAETLEVE